jgi:hypothetical protein
LPVAEEAAQVGSYGGAAAAGEDCEHLHPLSLARRVSNEKGGFG